MGGILNTSTRHRAGLAAGIATIAGLLAGCGAPGQQTTGEFGTVSLKAGETRQVQTGYVYRNMRVCNDAESAGSISATIDDHVPHELLPGVCAEDLGNSVLLVNHGSSLARVTYRPIYDIPLPLR
jgi:hypothetical protein